MKMNIKGLVFVGFAAAVFASAANAADKVVTSKQYVDAKISGESTISSSSTTTAPNEKAVYDALSALDGVPYTGAAPIAVDPSTHIISTTAEANVLEGVQVNGVDQTITNKKVNLGEAAGKAVAAGITATDTGLPTAQQVYNYIDTNVGAVYTGTNPISVDPDTHVISTTAEANILEGVQVNGVDQTIDANKKVNLGAAAGKAVDTAITSSANDTAVPTSKAVYDFLNNGASTANCSDTNPCAFVLGSNGTPEWKPIAQ